MYIIIIYFVSCEKNEKLILSKIIILLFIYIIISFFQIKNYIILFFEEIFKIFQIPLFKV